MIAKAQRRDDPTVAAIAEVVRVLDLRPDQLADFVCAAREAYLAIC